MQQRNKQCRHGCDWYAPSVEVRKSFLVSNHSWSGDEHDYWEFEDKFYESDNEEKQKKLLAEKEYKIKNLKETIENAQKELKKLENLQMNLSFQMGNIQIGDKKL